MSRGNQGNNGGDRHYRWNGGKTSKGGYPYIRFKDHPKADRDGYVAKHVLVCESALGKFLPSGAEIHHVNENRADFSNRNLVICQDRAYHSLLHARMRILAVGGDPNTQKFCGKCDVLLDRSDFGKARGRGDGLENKCLNCERSRRRGR